MAGANEIFNNLFDSFKANDFFNDALYSFSWTEVVSTGIDRTTGDAIVTTTVYSSDAFLINPSKSERPQQSVFKNIKAGDVAVILKQNELIKAPTLDETVTFDGIEYTCKEIVQDPAKVTWKFLLRR